MGTQLPGAANAAAQLPCAYIGNCTKDSFLVPVVKPAQQGGQMDTPSRCSIDEGA